MWGRGDCPSLTATENRSGGKGLTVLIPIAHEAVPIIRFYFLISSLIFVCP